MIDHPPIRLAWRPTWEVDTRTDFAASDPVGEHGNYCRIYKATSAATLGWFWTASDGHRDLGHGYEPTAREAAERAEKVYFRLAETDRPPAKFWSAA